ncbi:MAG: radical SAM protein [Alphaproteobacteria bacterium]|nr:radical SAM protein [Alphaproteobacteria bacterium]
MATNTLILTVTRACNLRCVYCPTVKDGWPSLSEADVVRGLDLFVDRFGGGDVKLFGGEPLLAPDIVRAALEHARTLPTIRRMYLSTNGLGLTADWLDYLRDYPKAILTISLDGKPEDNRKFRRANDGVGDAYDHVVSLLPELLTVPRVVITQTIPPTTAGRAAENFAHLRSLGFWRFNLLPGYYIPWKDERLADLRTGFDGIRAQIVDAWAKGERLYLRNLFTLQPTPFFNTGFIIDADRTIHPSNVGLSGSLDELLDTTRVGDLDHPPSNDELEAKAATINDLLQRSLPPRVWQSTMAVDAELTRLCRSLYPAYRRYRAARQAAA